MPDVQHRAITYSLLVFDIDVVYNMSIEREI